MPSNFYSLLTACSFWLPINGAVAQEAQPATLAPLIIDPSSTSVAGGNVKLSTTVLSRRAETFVGDYQIRVTPYFFKNQKGSLVITVPEASLRKLNQGAVMEFAGKAIRSGTGEIKPIHVRAVSAAKDHGDLTITISTDNGPLVFNSAYRFGDT